MYFLLRVCAECMCVVASCCSSVHSLIELLPWLNLFFGVVQKVKGVLVLIRREKNSGITTGEEFKLSLDCCQKERGSGASATLITQASTAELSQRHRLWRHESAAAWLDAVHWKTMDARPFWLGSP